VEITAIRHRGNKFQVHRAFTFRQTLHDCGPVARGPRG